MMKVCNVIGCENECVSECLNRFDSKYEFSMRMKSDIGVKVFSSGSMVSYERELIYGYDSDMNEYVDCVKLKRSVGKSNVCGVCGSIKDLIRFKRLNEYRCYKCLSRREKFVSKDEEVIVVKVGKFMREMYSKSGVKIVYRDGRIKKLEKFVWLLEEKWNKRVSEELWRESNFRFWSMKSWLEFVSDCGRMNRLEELRLERLVKVEMINDLRLYEEELGIKLVK